MIMVISGNIIVLLFIYYEWSSICVDEFTVGRENIFAEVTQLQLLKKEYNWF